jgi:hypothetical protein
MVVVIVVNVCASDVETLVDSVIVVNVCSFDDEIVVDSVVVVVVG